MIDLTQLQIPGPDVVPEPTDFDFAFCRAELSHYNDATETSRGAILSRVICSLARRCRELEAEIAAVNNFEAVAERCKRAESRTGELITQCKDFQNRNLAADNRIEELTRQRDELLRACNEIRSHSICCEARYTADAALKKVKGVADGVKPKH